MMHRPGHSAARSAWENFSVGLQNSLVTLVKWAKIKDVDDPMAVDSALDSE